MSVFEYKERRSSLLLQIMDAVEEQNEAAEAYLRNQMAELDAFFKNLRNAVSTA